MAWPYELTAIHLHTPWSSISRHSIVRRWKPRSPSIKYLSDGWIRSWSLNHIRSGSGRHFTGILRNRQFLLLVWLLKWKCTVYEWPGFKVHDTQGSRSLFIDNAYIWNGTVNNYDSIPMLYYTCFINNTNPYLTKYYLCINAQHLYSISLSWLVPLHDHGSFMNSSWSVNPSFLFCIL